MSDFLDGDYEVGSFEQEAYWMLKAQARDLIIGRARAAAMRKRIEEGILPEAIQLNPNQHFSFLLDLEALAEDFQQKWQMTKQIVRHCTGALFVASNAHTHEEVMALARELAELEGKKCAPRRKQEEAAEALNEVTVIASLLVRERGKMWDLVRCTIHPDLRRMGIASSIMKEVQNQAMKHERIISAPIHVLNAPALNFLTRKMGFEHADQIGQMYVMEWKPRV